MRIAIRPENLPALGRRTSSPPSDIGFRSRWLAEWIAHALSAQPVPNSVTAMWSTLARGRAPTAAILTRDSG